MKYWEVFNSTDRELKFYTDEGTRSTLKPGERAKIMRGKSFGYAIASKSGKLLKDSATRKHFITIFHRGYAADYTNKRNKWESWGEAKDVGAKAPAPKTSAKPTHKVVVPST